VSGDGGVEAAQLDGQDFDMLTEAPSDGYETDAGSGDAPEYVLGEWYNYDYSTHVLTAADRTYVIMTTEGDYFRFRMVDYYNDDGASGYPSFLWGEVSAP
jgi:hypothetical protein